MREGGSGDGGSASRRPHGGRWPPSCHRLSRVASLPPALRPEPAGRGAASAPLACPRAPPQAGAVVSPRLHGDLGLPRARAHPPGPRAQG